MTRKVRESTRSRHVSSSESEKFVLQPIVLALRLKPTDCVASRDYCPSCRATRSPSATTYKRTPGVDKRREILVLRSCSFQAWPNWMSTYFREGYQHLFSWIRWMLPRALTFLLVGMVLSGWTECIISDGIFLEIWNILICSLLKYSFLFLLIYFLPFPHTFDYAAVFFVTRHFYYFFIVFFIWYSKYLSKTQREN